MTAYPPARYGGARLRADARRNRDQIIDSARTLFTRQGFDVPMEEIARHAGVGVGTLYRRFADRDELIRALAVDTFGRLLADAEAAEAAGPDAWAALGGLLRLSTHLRLIMRLAMFSPRAGLVLQDSPEVAEFRRALLELLDRIVARAQAEGSLRADIGTGDVVALLAMVLHPPPNVPAGNTALIFERCLALVLDGLSTHPRTALPGRPLTVPDVSPWSV